MSTGRMARCVLPALPRLCSLAEQAKPQLFTSPLLNCHLLCNTAHREISLEDPVTRVPLFPWRLPVRLQHSVDELHDRFPPRLLPIRGLPRRGHRITQGLSHHP